MIIKKSEQTTGYKQLYMERSTNIEGASPDAYLGRTIEIIHKIITLVRVFV